MAQMTIKCPHCSTELQAQDEWIGMDVECPVCKKMFSIQPEKQAQSALNPADNMADAGTFTFICPSCDGKVELSENLRGTQYECQFCFETHIANAAPTDTIPVLQPIKVEEKFIFICPECDTVSKLPESAKDKEYECPCCCETVIAKPAVERTCPKCKEKIKIKAIVCRHCKSNVPPIIPNNTVADNKQIIGIKPSCRPFSAGANQAIIPSLQPIMGTNTVANNIITPELARGKTWTGLVLWSLLWPGLGQCYLGQKNKAIQYGAITIAILILSCFLALIPGIGGFLGRIVFLCGCACIIGESFATLSILQMGGSVERDKWLPRTQQQRTISSMPPEIKKKWMTSLAVVIAAMLLGITGPGILSWIAFFASISM